jgi:hypothetical protein
MNSNIIYSCFDYTGRETPGYLHLHIYLLKQYASKYNIDLKIINTRCDYFSRLYIKHLAYDDFSKSSYNKMLWVDTDVFISPDSPDIFKDVTGDFSAKQITDQDTTTNKLDNKYMKSFLSVFKNDHMYDTMYNSYFNTGVMVITKCVIDKIIDQWYDTYTRLKSIYTKGNMLSVESFNIHENRGIFREEFITNYVVLLNNICVSPINTMYHQSVGHIDDINIIKPNPGWFVHYDGYDNNTKNAAITESLIDGTLF